MERNNGSADAGREFVGAPTIDMFSGMTQIVRFHQLAQVCKMDGSERTAEMFRKAAARRGRQLITLTEGNLGYKLALDRSLRWLAGRDYEMHELVKGTLEQAQAARDIAQINRKICIP